MKANTLFVSRAFAAAFLFVVLFGATVNALPRRGMMLAPPIGDLGASQLGLQRDINDLANAGANIVRLPIYFPVQPSTNWWIGLTEAAYETCYARRVNLVIDFHWPGSLPNSTITNESDFVRKWERFAAHFARKPQDRMNIWYDLCNEPNGRNPSGWPALALRTAQTIRNYDTQSRIVYAYPGTNIPSTISTNFRPLPGISRQIVEFHFYNWRALQSDWSGNTVRYPDTTKSFTKTAMQEALARVRDFGRQNGVPVFIGHRSNPHNRAAKMA